MSAQNEIAQKNHNEYQNENEENNKPHDEMKMSRKKINRQIPIWRKSHLVQFDTSSWDV